MGEEENFRHQGLANSVIFRPAAMNWRAAYPEIFERSDRDRGTDPALCRMIQLRTPASGRAHARCGVPRLGNLTPGTSAIPLACFDLAVARSVPEAESAHMPRPCGQRDRLKEAYYQAAIEASSSSAVLKSVPFGPEFNKALDSAEAAAVLCREARRALDEHCEEHGCSAEFPGPL